MVATVKVADVAAIRAGTRIVESSVFAAMSARGLGSRRLRNVGRNGSRLGIVSRTEGTGGSAFGVVKATGPWQIVEGNTSAHLIEPGISSDALALKIGDGFAAYANHPGTHGKHAWKAGVDVARPAVAKSWEREMSKAIASVF